MSVFQLFPLLLWFTLVSASLPESVTKIADYEHAKLHALIRADDAVKVRQMIANTFHGMIDSANSTNYTMLMVASFHNSRQVLNDLIKDSPNLIAKNFFKQTALHFATINGHTGVVQALVDAARHTEQPLHELIEPLDGFGMQPIHVAMERNRIDIVKIFLSLNRNLAQVPCCGQNVSKTISHIAAEHDFADFLTQIPEHFNAMSLDAQGQNPACYAAAKGSLNFATKMSKLLKINLNSGRCVYGDQNQTQVGTPLHSAAYYRQKAFVDLLLSQQNVGDQMILANGSGSPLHAMALKSPYSTESSDESILKAIHKKNGAVLDSVDVNGQTPFLLAIKSSSISFAKLLVKRGATVTMRDKMGYSVVHLAEDVKTFDYLVSQRTFAGQIEAKTEQGHLTPLQVAVVENKRIDYVKYLLELTTNASMTNSQGKTVVHLAVEKNNTKVVELFLEKATFPALWVRDTLGRTPLLLAVELGRTEVAKMLISNKRHYAIGKLLSSSETAPGTEDSPFHFAAKFNRSEIVHALLARDPNMVSLVNSRKETPLHHAISNENAEVVKALLPVTHPTVVQMQDQRGRTPLHLLAMRCSPFQVEIGKLVAGKLLGAAKDVVDSFGETLLETAVKHNCPKFVQILLENNVECGRKNRLTGYTPLHVAKKLGFDQLADLMVGTGKCSLDQTDACNIPVRKIGGNFSTTSAQQDRCEALPLIKNGEFVETPQPPFCLGSRVQFQCEAGHPLRGLNAVVCNSDGKWLIQGHCEGNEPALCSEPPVISNAILNAPAAAGYGSTASFTCQTGYTPRGSNSIECNRERKWLIKGHCESAIMEASKCGEAPLIENGVLVGVPGGSTPAKMAFTCNPGYAVRGSSLVECNSVGKWQIKGFCDGFCPVPVFCYGEMPSSNLTFKIGSQRPVNCLAGFTKSGPGMVSCGPDGQWQSQSTRCSF